MPNYDEDLQKRFDDIREIKEMLTEGKDIPVLHWWSFSLWGLLLGIGATVHYVLNRSLGIDSRTALSWIWLPVIIVAGAIEGTSFAIMANKHKIPLIGRRFGGTILNFLATFIVLIALVIHFTLNSVTPGLGLLMCALPIGFYAQMSFPYLLIETYGFILIGLLFNFAGAGGPAAFLAAALLAAALFIVCGIHILLVQRKKRV